MANWITISRFPLLLGFVLMLYLGEPWVRLVGVPVLFALLMLDTIDGVVARATGKTSLIGSVLDIAADRAYELVLWVCFTDLRVIPLAIPLIVIVRTTLTDALRSIGVSQGLRPFDQHRSKLGRFLVSSSWMRTSYSFTKITAFCGLTLGIAMASYPAGTRLHEASLPVLRVFLIVAWIATALCVVRGLPVIAGAIRRGLESAQSRDSSEPG
jgi:phosphatidylglycerophosphate synthase